MKFKTLIIIGIFLNLLNPSLADDKNNDISFYVGTFDVIDKEGDDQASLLGMVHKNTNLFRDTMLGKFSPITGGFVTGKNSVYLYTGIEGEYNIGSLKIYPSFAPGYYEKGDGKDLGHVLEFKSELQLSYSASENSSFGISYNHVSNASLGDKNPGANSYMFNFLKNF